MSQPLLGSCQTIFAVRRKIYENREDRNVFPVPYYIS
nr:MAG TPA: hypothetical protein [Caudoviricetes sp.]